MEEIILLFKCWRDASAPLTGVTEVVLSYCEMVHIKDLIERIAHEVVTLSLLSFTEWLLIICLMPHNNK